MQQEDVKVDEIEIEKEWERRERESPDSVASSIPGSILHRPVVSTTQPKTRSHLFPLCLSTPARRRAPP
jgi:hypothetical protein